jgi:hypothetical protein
VLLDEIDNDYELFTLCKDETEKINNSFIHDIIEYKSKAYTKEDDDTFFIQSKMTKYRSSADYLEENAEEDGDQMDEEDKYEQRMEYIKEKGKKELAEKYGYEPNEDQLETYVEDYLKNMEDNEIFDGEVYSAFTESSRLKSETDYGELSENYFEDGDASEFAT